MSQKDFLPLPFVAVVVHTMLGAELMLRRVLAIFIVLGFSCGLSCKLVAQGNVVDIIATGPNANVQTISQVVLNVNGGVETQNTPATGATVGVTSATLQSLTIGAGVLDNFDFATPTIEDNGTNFFPTSGQPNIEVLTSTGPVGIGGNNSTFLDALAQTYTNGDLVNYLRVDGTNLQPSWDVIYNEALNTDDYLIFEERDGNTTFTIDVLDDTGNLIAGANTLSFDGNSYQWSIGYSNIDDPNGAQSQVLGVIEFDLFNTSTPIGGFRVNNTGNADFKFFVGSLAIPEPGTGGSILLISLLGWARRRRYQ